MRLIIESDYKKLSAWAARHVVERINAFGPTEERPFVLGLPTGSSPEGMYAELVKANREGRVSFRNVITFNMDEYVGLPENHPRATTRSCAATSSIILTSCPRISISSTVMPRTWRQSVTTTRR